ncbi:MAG: twin-arginine translocase TatA/TatE family subunit [Pseudomonas sp.]
MEMMGISIWQLLIILLIVITLFGTKRLRGLGSDVGNAISGFRKAVNDGESNPQALEAEKLKRQQHS